MSIMLLGLAVVVAIASVLVLLIVATRPSAAQRKREAFASRIDTLNLADTAPGAAAAGSSSVLTRARAAAESRTQAVLAERGWLDKIGADLKAAGWAITAERWVLTHVVVTIGLGVGMFLLSGGSMAAGLFGVLMGAAIPAMALRHRRGKRRAQFVMDLPEVLTSMAAALQASQSMSVALQSATEETSGVMQDEMDQVLIDYKLGDDLADALSASATRMGSEDLEWVAITLRLQAKHGGALAVLLSNVANTIRERVALKRQVQTLSAEGRLSIVVLMALPFGMLAFMAVARPEYFSFFLTGFGLIILALCAVMMLLGYLWARSIVKVEV